MYYIKWDAFYPVGDTVKDTIKTGLHQGKKEAEKETEKTPQQGKTVFAPNPLLQEIGQENQGRPDNVITDQPGRKPIDKDFRSRKDKGCKQGGPQTENRCIEYKKESNYLYIWYEA